MKKIVFFAFLWAFLFSSVALRADFAKAGIREISSAPYNGKMRKDFQDSQGRIFSVIYAGELDSKKIGQILEGREIFIRWPGLEIRQMVFSFQPDALEIWILPASLQTSMGNLASYMPSGMVFYLTDSLYYDFRMTKDNIFFKMRGNYLSFESFTAQIHKALENPLAYIRLYDPDYYLTKMDEYARDIEKLKAQAEEQQKALDFLRSAVIYFQNSGFLSGSSQVSKAALDRAVLLKKSNLKMSKKELISLLEKEGIKLSDREAELIFAVYFNQFE